jgi:hypothetical protein
MVGVVWYVLHDMLWYSIIHGVICCYSMVLYANGGTVCGMVQNPTMRTGLDFKSAQEAKPKTGSKCKDLKSSPVLIGGFEMTSHMNTVNHYQSAR